MGREMIKKNSFLEYLVYVICPYKFRLELRNRTGAKLTTLLEAIVDDVWASSQRFLRKLKINKCRYLFLVLKFQEELHQIKT